MECPYCHRAIKPPEVETGMKRTADGYWAVVTSDCPACDRTTIRLKALKHHPQVGLIRDWERIVHPIVGIRAKAPDAVPEPLAGLYDEASAVAESSPRAAGALLRRALQQLIRDYFEIQKPTLDAEITALISSNQVPGYITDVVDSVRVVGNFSAHPIKSTNSGEVIDIEPGEVELCFDVLEALFEFCYVEPARIGAKKAALNAKLEEAGKPPLK